MQTRGAGPAIRTDMTRTGRLPPRTPCRTLQGHSDDARPEFCLASFSRTIEGDYDEVDRYCALMHNLRRQIHPLTRADPLAVLADAPPATRTRWDALLWWRTPPGCTAIQCPAESTSLRISSKSRG